MSNYSRRDLYALGEPLGNSVTRNKVGGGRIYGSGGGDIVSGIGDAIGGAVSSVGDFVGQAAQDIGTGLASVDKGVGDIPGGWLTVGGLAAGGAYGLASLGEAAAASAVTAADATAAGMGFSSAAEAISAGAISAEGLGLPAATTLGDLAAASGSASSGFLGLGDAAAYGPGWSAAGFEGGASAFSPEMIAAANASSDPIGMLSAMSGMSPEEVAAATGAGAQQGTSLSNILGYAKTGAQIVGGVSRLAGAAGQIFGGANALKTGRQVQPGLADPNSPYRAGYASQLANLVNNPSSVTQTPGYQFRFGQGLQGLQASQAAQGRLVSGGALLQSQQFGQNFANQSYNDQVNTLAQLSGATQSPAQGAGAMANIANTNLGTTLGGWQNIAGGVGNIASPLQTLYSMYNQPSPNPTA